MKLLINESGGIAGTATDAYVGPMAWAVAPEDFDPARIAEYTVVDGVVVLVPTTKITRLAFRNRFIQTEKIGLELASQHNPAASLPAQQMAAALRSYLADVAAANYIDLARPDTRAAVQYLETSGLLGAGRALQILDTPIQPEERPL